MSNVKETLQKLKEMQRNGTTIERESTAELEGNRSINGWIYDEEASKQFKVEDNPFPFLFVDLTYRCNMACNVCYNPVRPTPDMTLEYFNDIVSRLPNPIEIRMLGGEPTIHPQFFDFMDTCFKYGHNVYVSSNGKTVANDINFAHEVKRISNLYPTQKLKWHMDMSGGKDNNFYKLIHGEPAYEEKVECLENLKEANIGRVTVSAILIRDVNEDVIPQMFEIADEHSRIVREIAFRSQGRIGRFIGNAEPYYTNDWKRLMMKYKMATPTDFGKVIMAGFMSEKCGGKNCCYHYQHNRKLNVSWLDFLCNTCWLRGQLVEGTDKVEYMFESLQANDFNKL